LSETSDPHRTSGGFLSFVQEQRSDAGTAGSHSSRHATRLSITSIQRGALPFKERGGLLRCGLILLFVDADGS
jgi:hypothetical protein